MGHFAISASTSPSRPTSQIPPSRVGLRRARSPHNGVPGRDTGRQVRGGLVAMAVRSSQTTTSEGCLLVMVGVRLRCPAKPVKSFLGNCHSIATLELHDCPPCTHHVLRAAEQIHPIPKVENQRECTLTESCPRLAPRWLRNALSLRVVMCTRGVVSWIQVWDNTRRMPPRASCMLWHCAGFTSDTKISETGSSELKSRKCERQKRGQGSRFLKVVLWVREKRDARQNAGTEGEQPHSSIRLLAGSPRTERHRALSARTGSSVSYSSRQTQS